MTLSTDDEWNWKHALGYLIWKMDTDLPLVLGVYELYAKHGSGAQITGVR